MPSDMPESYTILQYIQQRRGAAQKLRVDSDMLKVKADAMDHEMALLEQALQGIINEGKP